MGEDGYFSVWMNLLDKANICLFTTILLYQVKIESKIVFFLISFLAISMTISIMANNFDSGFITLIFFPLEYLVLFTIVSNYSINRKLMKIIIVIMTIWAIAPIYLLAFGSLQDQIALVTGVDGKLSTFGGFAYHRNFYGFYTGLTIILLIITPFPKVFKVLSITLCAVGIILSGSRSSLVCVLASLIVLLFLFNKKKFISILPFLIGFGSLALFIFSYFGIRQKGLEDNDDRFEIITGFWGIIRESPLWGNGKYMLYYSQHYPEGAPAHNFIFQVWGDYGIFALLGFVLLLLIAYFKGNKLFKTLFFYLLTFGLTQPYFYLSMPQAFMVIIFIIGSCYSIMYNRQNLDTYDMLVSLKQKDKVY